MTDVVAYTVAVRGAAEVLVKALVLRDFLPSRLAAQRAHTPGDCSVEELEDQIVEHRARSIAARMCMAQADHGFFSGSWGTSIAGSIDRAGELILGERALEHASPSAASANSVRGARKRAARDQADQPLPELAFMTIREVARAVWTEGLGLASLAEAEELIRGEHAARMTEYRGRPVQVCPFTRRECHPLTGATTCR
ncbi:hypothetical protein ABWJ92_24045 [Streptomyces sp. NPDC000609]|uniref:hypothetical protein n=1 Tax=Streptomyces sp. NPDC000609 TaxID=3160957 RepID=UPI0033945EFC